VRLINVCIIDGQTKPIAWPFSVFTPKQVFGPRTAKFQPIWIKFCTHLLLYGIHLWADLDRVSGPNQNDYIFCNTCVTHPKSYIETTDRRDFGGKPSKWRWGRLLSWKILDFYSEGQARTAKQHFFAFLGYPSTILRTAYTGNKCKKKTVVYLQLITAKW